VNGSRSRWQITPSRPSADEFLLDSQKTTVGNGYFIYPPSRAIANTAVDAVNWIGLIMERGFGLRIDARLCCVSAYRGQTSIIQ
jgi:hypothetical protein